MLSIILKIGPMGIPLVTCFAVMIIIVTERLFFLFKKTYTIGKDIYEIFLIDRFEENTMLPKEIREELLACDIEKIKLELLRGTLVLKFFSIIAPMLGLIGTVFGMISIFGAISSSGMAITPATIAYGFEEAMYATAFGLIIGVPSAGFSLLFSHIAESRTEGYIVKFNELNAGIEKMAFIKNQVQDTNDV